MRIRKTFQGEIPENKIVNMQSNSQTDAYSADFVNKKIKTAKTTSNNDTYSCTYINGLVATDAIEIGLTARYEYTAVSWQDTVINYNNTNEQVGSKLTRNGNRVVIGAGVNYVLCIGVGVDSTGNGVGFEHDSGFKKNGQWNYGHSYETPNGGLDTHTIAAIIPVTQGDYIQHYYNTGGTPTFTVYERSHLIVIALK